MIARLLMRLAIAALPVRVRDRYREEWAADLRDSAGYGIPPHRIASAAIRFSIATRLEGHVMQPIGPLAIALRHSRGVKPVTVLAIALGLALLAGVGLLVV